MEIEYIIIDNKRFGIVKERRFEDIKTTYVYLSNLDDPKEQLIRKYMDNNKDILLPLETDTEFNFALNLYTE